MAAPSPAIHPHQLAHARPDRGLVLILADDPPAAFVVETVAADKDWRHLRPTDRLGEFLKLGLQRLGAVAKLAEHEAEIILARPPVHDAALKQIDLPQKAIEILRGAAELVAGRVDGDALLPRQDRLLGDGRADRSPHERCRRLAVALRPLHEFRPLRLANTESEALITHHESLRRERGPRSSTGP